MNRIQTLFQAKATGILSVYFTAGYPQRDDTVSILKSLEDHGADMAEIGMPFSDPLADGPVIQESSQQALKNGMSLQVLFDQLKDIRSTIRMPLILMGYLNPVLRFGMEPFCRQAAQAGIDGIILPDMPVDIYRDSYQQLFDAYGLCNIFLVTPQTPDERIRLIDKLGTGFTYLVSVSSTTGARSGFRTAQLEYFRRIRNMHLANPALIGFGISNHQAYRQACEYANGAIIGSAFIKEISGGSGDLDSRIRRFIKKIIHP